MLGCARTSRFINLVRLDISEKADQMSAEHPKDVSDESPHERLHNLLPVLLNKNV